MVDENLDDVQHHFWSLLNQSKDARSMVEF